MGLGVFGGCITPPPSAVPVTAGHEWRLVLLLLVKQMFVVMKWLVVLMSLNHNHYGSPYIYIKQGGVLDIHVFPADES